MPSMTSPHIQITRRGEFSAAHRLHDPGLSEVENRAMYGPCCIDHGHNYAVEVTVRGPLPRSGMVMDLNRLTILMQEEIISQVDHRHLNRDVPFLNGLIPTAEVLAVAFWERLEPRLASLAPCRLHRVRVYESRDNFVEYHGQQA